MSFSFTYTSFALPENSLSSILQITKFNYKNATTAKEKEKIKSSLKEIINKFYGSNPNKTSTTSNPYNSNNPLTNPFANPLLNQLFSGFGSGANTNGSLNPFNQNSSQPNSLNPYLPSSNSQVSLPPGQSADTSSPDSFRASGDGNGNGFGEVVTTVFGHNRNGSSDSADNGMPSCNGNCSTRKGGKCEKIVSLKASLRNKIFGRNKWCGAEIEVIYPAKKTCGVYPLYETGPAERLQASMDLTGTIWNELDPGGNSGKATMRFRVLKTGDKPCEGYKRVDGKS